MIFDEIFMLHLFYSMEENIAQCIENGLISLASLRFPKRFRGWVVL